SRVALRGPVHKRSQNALRALQKIKKRLSLKCSFIGSDRKSASPASAGKRGRELLLFSHDARCGKQRAQGLRRKGSKLDRLAARKHGGQDQRGIARGEEKNPIFGWLLQDFKDGVCRLRGHPIRIRHQENAISAFMRPKSQRLLDLAKLVDLEAFRFSGLFFFVRSGSFGPDFREIDP